MKFTVIGDPHAKPDNLIKINQLFDIIEELGNPCIILGDLLDTKEVVRGKCLNTYLNRISESRLDFTLLVGNHDWFNKECEDHSLKLLGLLNNVTLVDEPMIRNGIQFYPYMKSYPKLKAGMPIIGHFDIIGFDYGNGYISKDGLDKSDFSKSTRVISGHYHKYQEVGNITYLGTPFSHSFGESNQIKYIGIYDTDTDALDLVETPFPQHQTYEMDADEKCPVMDDNDYNRVILSGTKDLVDSIEIPEVKLIKRYTESTAKTIISETQTPQAQFQSWASEIKELTPETIKLGLEILSNV